ncbi:MAG: ferrous iron transport protein A [Tissierellia bacterium]|nr:ferrous iron transport protein A [Tissierellia bacterium]
MNSLDSMPVGKKCKVKEISKNTSIKKRLLDMGVVPGVTVEIMGKAPLGDPIEVLLRGYKLTLRKEEAANIFVE